MKRATRRETLDDQLAKLFIEFHATSVWRTEPCDFPLPLSYVCGSCDSRGFVLESVNVPAPSKCILIRLYSFTEYPLIEDILHRIYCDRGVKPQPVMVDFDI